MSWNNHRVVFYKVKIADWLINFIQIIFNKIIGIIYYLLRYYIRGYNVLEYNGGIAGIKYI